MRSAAPDTTAARVALKEILRPGDLVAVAQGACEPLGLSRALVEQAHELPAITVFMGFSLSGLYDVQLAQSVRLLSYGAMSSLSSVAAAGLLDVVPCNYSDLPGLMRGALRPDVVMVQVAPADEDGCHSLGLCADYTVEAIENARVVVAEVNDQMPQPPSGTKIAAGRVDVSVAVSRPLLAVPATAPTETDIAIASHVVALIPDGATLQLGFGATVNAIGRLLTKRRDLRIHSALVGDWLLDLDRHGALAVSDDRPAVVTGAALGSEELYRFVGSSDAVQVRRIEQVQSLSALASQQGLIAVNSALQVDLGGQTNVEMVGERRVSALGGHTDFLRGAQSAAGGLSIVALPATAARGTISRIVSRLDSSWVSSQQSVVDVVITENGAAQLRGATLSQRRDALIGIADPAHRDSLAAAAPELLETGT